MAPQDDYEPGQISFLALDSTTPHEDVGPNVSATTEHVRFSEPDINILEFISGREIDPNDPETWLFLYRNQHSPFGICSYCLAMQDEELYARQHRLIASQLVQSVPWDAAEAETSIYRRAEIRAREYVRRIQLEAERAEHSNCMREYQLLRKDSLDEYTLAKMIPGIDAETVRMEWDRYLERMSKVVARKLRRARVKRMIKKFLRLGRPL